MPCACVSSGILAYMTALIAAALLIFGLLGLPAIHVVSPLVVAIVCLVCGVLLLAGVALPRIRRQQ